MDMPCPVMESFLLAALNVPVTKLNKDLLESLQEMKLQTEQERVGFLVVSKRALRAYELAFRSVLSTDLRDLEVVPVVRASPNTFDWYLAEMRDHVDDAVVDNMEFAFGVVDKRGSAQAQRVTMRRLQQGGLRLIGETTHLNEALRRYDRQVLGRMGQVLADICSVMAIGMSKQLLFAEQLLRV